MEGQPLQLCLHKCCVASVDNLICFSMQKGSKWNKHCAQTFNKADQSQKNHCCLFSLQAGITHFCLTMLHHLQQSQPALIVMHSCLHTTHKELMQSVFVLTSDQALQAKSCLLFLAQGLKTRVVNAVSNHHFVKLMTLCVWKDWKMCNMGILKTAAACCSSMQHPLSLLWCCQQH